MRKRHVLVVDDEEWMRSLLSETLVRTGYLVTTADDATEALEVYSR